ncbi:MAG: SpoIIE family protein phosphatase [Anaerolineales bacterium]|nr:SpoIIE family protein phosphatase [Anaerolineales bacterium]
MNRSTAQTVVLKSVFSGVDQESLDALRAVARKVTYPPHTVLTHQGQIEHTLYVVVKGRVAVTQILEDGVERLLGFVGANKTFGEMGLIDDAPRMATCTTVMETTVLEVDEIVFDAVLKKSPAIAYAMLRKILESSRTIDRAAIQELNEKNASLQKAYRELQEAQAKLVENERFQKEMELAAHVQQSLLPASLPVFPGYHFAAYIEPARQVGGDFYDVTALDDEHVGIVLADVADKGFHAALFMAVSRTLFLQEGKHALSPAAVALAVHRGMMEVSATDDIFVTAFYGVLHRPSGRLTYVRAAQERPLLYRPGVGVQALPADGRFLGMFPELTLVEDTVYLQPGDRLIIFSDGVPDAVNPEQQRYGYERLHAALSSGGSLSAPALVNHIVEDLDRWSLDAAPFDDVTLLVVAV